MGLQLLMNVEQYGYLSEAVQEAGIQVCMYLLNSTQKIQFCQSTSVNCKNHVKTPIIAPRNIGRHETQACLTDNTW